MSSSLKSEKLLFSLQQYITHTLAYIYIVHSAKCRSHNDLISENNRHDSRFRSKNLLINILACVPIHTLRIIYMNARYARKFGATHIRMCIIH